MPRRSTRGKDTSPKTENAAVKQEENSSPNKRKNDTQPASKPTKRAKTSAVKEEDIDTTLSSVLPSLASKYANSTAADTKPADIPLKDPAALLKDRKLKAYTATATASPFPNFPHPTASEAKRAHKILAGLHGARKRPDKVVASTTRAGCGDSPSVLDALVRTILSQNTSDVNSTRAKRSMDKAYGGSDEWEAIVEGGQEKLEEAIRCGGLSKTKSRVIVGILEQTKEKYGVYSLDHLFEASNEDAMRELLGLKGVGPKTASCVLLFCLQRQSFAVDTHVHRISGLLGWRPAKASREETHAHLDLRIPDEDKYGLHILMVTHGKRCEECKAGGRNIGKCELRKAFKKAIKAEDE